MTATHNFYVRVIPEKGPTTYFDLEERPLIIGRSPSSSNISIEDRRISRVHLHIELDPTGQVRVMDLDTLNGTKLDDRALEPNTLFPWQPGQVIAIGKTKLILEGSPAQEMATAGLPRSAQSARPPEKPAHSKLATTEMKILAEETTSFGRLLNTFGMVLVLALSLVLLAYVGFGEASRTYPTIVLDSIAAQGEVIVNSMDTSLKAGLPLEQFPGFLPLTQPLLESNDSIVSVYVTDLNDRIIYANTQAGETLFDPSAPPTFTGSPLQKEDSRLQISESAALYRIRLDLSSKFEMVGHLYLTLEKSVVTQQINTNFINVVIAGGVLLIIFALYIAIDLFISARRATDGGHFLNAAYFLAFLLMAVTVVLTLINLYSTGIQGKTQALANSLGQRLNTPLQLGLDITDFADLDRIFADYQSLNPDISFIALTSDNVNIINTDPALVGTEWKSPPSTFEFTLPLNRPGTFANADTELHVGIPTSAVYSRLWTSVKNFVVLFVAAGFLSLLFFNLMRTFLSRRAFRGGRQEDIIAAQQKALLGLIRPFYFLAVFAEGLTASFLPQYLKGLAGNTGVDTSLVSTLFTIYFLAFVLALLPAGHFAERRGVKPLLLAGTFLIILSMGLTAVVTNIYLMFPIRALAGLGQGILLIGVQSYILEVATGGQQTQGAAIIVFGYNGGMISGTAIGALLVVYMQPTGVFIVGAATALFAFLYAIFLIPRVVKTEQIEEEKPKQGFWRNLADAARDFEFVKAMLFIGIPAKAVLTGVTIFALPLLLANQYAQEDIGQIIMMYAAGVLISSSYVSRVVDRVGKTTGILFLGTIGAGIGLVLIGLAGLDTLLPNVKTLMLIAGMIILGLAHGFIHAPIVTHISTTSAANVLGKSSATSLYRFLERIGHVSGPIIVGQLLFFGRESLIVISWLGMATIVLGVLFLIRVSPGIRSKQDPAISAPV